MLKRNKMTQSIKNTKPRDADIMRLTKTVSSEKSATLLMETKN